MLSCCVKHRHIDPAPGIMVWGGIGFNCRTPLVRIVLLFDSISRHVETDIARMEATLTIDLVIIQMLEESVI
ncbi:hypothetical protein TNCV_982921 [Trichonephila clavipes]|nr:hypothetical protein TNCV_982921 [Trichonephila clavipes]